MPMAMNLNFWLLVITTHLPVAKQSQIQFNNNIKEKH